MAEPRLRPLMTYDRTPGFLCDWHLAGPFEAGLTVDPNVRLFQKKHSEAWTAEHLASCGGAAGVVAPPPECGPWDWTWDLVPLTVRPQLSLTTAAMEFPTWQERLGKLNPDTWSKLYYALAVVDSPVDTSAELHFCGWDGCRLWINGKPAFEEHSYHHVILDLQRLTFPLRKGRNTFLFQLDRDGVAARIVLPDRPEMLGQLQSVAYATDPEPRRVATLVQLHRHAMQQEVRMPFTGRTPDELQQWRKEFYQHFTRCLGEAPASTLKPGAEQLISETRREGYVERLYHLPSEGGCVVPCFVLIPDNYNGRTLATVHGHNDYRYTLGQLDVGPDNWNNYTQRMARKGYIAGLICQRAFSDRDDRDRPGDMCETAAMRALAQGLTLARLQIADIQLMADLLGSLPEVDPQRLGITGLSGGGTLTYLAAALDDRFKAAAEFCGLCRYMEYATGNNGCGTQVVPGVFPTGDSGEILSLIAPRPLLLGQGRLDATFHVLGVQSIAQDARRAYQAAGVPERLEVAIYDRPHEFHPDVADAFFRKWL